MSNKQVLDAGDGYVFTPNKTQLVKDTAHELLEALQALTHSLEFEDLRHDDQRDAFKKAIAVIAKATGEA